MFWPGSDVKINGKRPTRAKEYDEELTSQERVDHLLGWIDEEPDFNLMAVYFSEVDHAGHYFGPYSSQVQKTLEETDAAIGNLLAGLEKKDMLKDLNVVVVSDHGMTQGSDKRKLFIENYVPKLKKLIEWADFGPVVSIIPKRGYEKRLAWKIWKAIQKHELPVKMYTKKNMPRAYHYTENERIPPIILEARRGWTIDTNDSEWHPKGLHGYGDSCRDMDGIFIGSGPQFLPSEPPKYSYYSNLDVYPLLCNLLDIIPNPNNGTLALLNKAIKKLMTIA
jgi:ectonucleotide pyrophosphatase/phosphodiesterase family protein 5